MVLALMTLLWGWSVRWAAREGSPAALLNARGDETGASEIRRRIARPRMRAGPSRREDSQQTSDTRQAHRGDGQDVTINEQNRVSTSRQDAGDNSSTLTGAHALVDLLNAGEPYAVAFGGQGGNWLENLEELVSSAGIESELSEGVGEAALLLERAARELVVVRPIGFDPMQWVRALAADEPLPTSKQLTTAAIS